VVSFSALEKGSSLWLVWDFSSVGMINFYKRANDVKVFGQ